MKRLFRYSDYTNPGDPGLGSFRLNARRAKDATRIFIDTKDEDSNTLAIGDISVGDTVLLQTENKKTRYK